MQHQHGHSLNFPSILSTQPRSVPPESYHRDRILRHNAAAKNGRRRIDSTLGLASSGTASDSESKQELTERTSRADSRPPQRNWDPASPLPPASQRRSLIRAFLDQDDIPGEYEPSRDGTPSRAPTAAEVRDVLAPWRPLALRRIACFLWPSYEHELVILRTHYGGDGDDARLRGWIDVDSEEDVFFNPEALWWRLLDDEELFGFGDEWERVFDILPELLGRQGRLGGVRRTIGAEDVEEARREEDPEEEMRYQAFTLSAPTPLLVADKRAFEEDKLRVLFLDAHGNIVKESRITPGEMGTLKEDATNVRSPMWWQYGEIGPKYKPDGEIGRVLYPAE